MTTVERLQDEIKQAADSIGYQNYLRARQEVLKMQDNALREEKGASTYWEEELAGFGYMLDASPLIIEKLRHHCYHITGLYEYTYRKHHAHAAKPFAAKLALLKKEDRNNLFVPESPILGGYGYDLNGALCNLDTLKFYECLIAMDRAGFLNGFRGEGAQKIVAEIGTGWGGFAYQFKTLFPHTTYILVDFPQSFLFSATYLLTAFPRARALFASNGIESFAQKDISAYDFIFIPHYGWEHLQFKRPDLLINTVSFQEMTTQQVDAYMRKAAHWGIPMVYSMNRERSRHNKELTSVSEVLRKYYNLEERKVLSVSPSHLPAQGKERIIQFGKHIAKRLLEKRSGEDRYIYRHISGKSL